MFTGFSCQSPNNTTSVIHWESQRRKRKLPPTILPHFWGTSSNVSEPSSSRRICLSHFLNNHHLPSHILNTYTILIQEAPVKVIKLAAQFIKRGFIYALF
jgi:hypothetical protein